VLNCCLFNDTVRSWDSVVWNHRAVSAQWIRRNYTEVVFTEFGVGLFSRKLLGVNLCGLIPVCWSGLTQSTQTQYRNSIRSLLFLLHVLVEGRDSLVGIATRYRLKGPGIESRWRRDLPHPSRRALGSTHPPIQLVPALFPRVKTAGAWLWKPTPSSAEVKERVEL